MLEEPAQIAQRGNLGREEAVRNCGIMGGRDRRDRALPRGVEMMPDGSELGRMLARIHMIIYIDRLETARILCSLDGLIEMKKPVVAPFSVGDEDVVVGVSGVDLALGSGNARDRRQ